MEDIPAIQIDKVSKTFHIDGQAVAALDCVSFTISTGSCTVVGGANGSGKSLLMSMIAGLDAPDEGNITVQGQIGLVFQDADAQILGETPEEDVAFGPANRKLGKKQIEQKTADALQKTGLTGKAHYPARSLSGGEKRRLAAAGVLAMDSQTIIFDEPYANLDYAGVIQVNALIQSLLDGHTTVLILTHELEKCLALADHFLVIFKGSIVFDGSPQEGLRQDLPAWGIRNPIAGYRTLDDLIWR